MVVKQFKNRNGRFKIKNNQDGRLNFGIFRSAVPISNIYNRQLRTQIHSNLVTPRRRRPTHDGRWLSRWAGRGNNTWCGPAGTEVTAEIALVVLLLHEATHALDWIRFETTCLDNM